MDDQTNEQMNEKKKRSNAENVYVMCTMYIEHNGWTNHRLYATICTMCTLFERTKFILHTGNTVIWYAQTIQCACDFLCCKFIGVFDYSVCLCANQRRRMKTLKLDGKLNCCSWGKIVSTVSSSFFVFFSLSLFNCMNCF